MEVESYYMANEADGKVNIAIGDFVENPNQGAREWSVLLTPEQAQEYALMIIAASMRAKQSKLYKAPEPERIKPVSGVEAYHCLDCDKLISSGSIGKHPSYHNTRKVRVTEVV